MFAGEFATYIRQGGGMYAVPYTTKIIVQKSIHLSEKTKNWFHNLFACNVIFTVKG